MDELDQEIKRWSDVYETPLSMLHKQNKNFNSASNLVKANLSIEKLDKGNKDPQIHAHQIEDSPIAVLKYNKGKSKSPKKPKYQTNIQRYLDLKLDKEKEKKVDWDPSNRVDVKSPFSPTRSIREDTDTDIRSCRRNLVKSPQEQVSRIKSEERITSN